MIEKWLAYICVYILVIMGVYTCSSLDIVTSMAMNRRIKRTKLSQGVTVSQFGRAVQCVLVAWGVPGVRAKTETESDTNTTTTLQADLLASESPSATADGTDTSQAFRFMMTRGLELERISALSVLELLMMVLDAPVKVGTGPSPVFFQWLEEHVDLWKRYAAHDPELREALRTVSLNE